MKKIAVIALTLSLISSAALAQDASGASAVVPGAAPGVVIAGGIGAGGIVLGVVGLLVLAGLGGSSSNTTTN